MFIDRINRWKTILAGFGIFGFVLSFIIGLIGGVSFGAILLRAFLFAGLFGGISLLIMFLIDTFIPELVDSEISDEQEIFEEKPEDLSESSGYNGARLDITIDDEDAEEVEAAEAADENIDIAEDMEELEEADDDEFTPAESEVPAASKAAKSASQSGSESDAMPDIGIFEGSFEAADTGGVSEGLSSIDGTGNSRSVEIMGNMHDTQEIVKAVQSVLKKDQEG